MYSYAVWEKKYVLQSKDGYKVSGSYIYPLLVQNQIYS